MNTRSAVTALECLAVVKFTGKRDRKQSLPGSKKLRCEKTSGHATAKSSANASWSSLDGCHGDHLVLQHRVLRSRNDLIRNIYWLYTQAHPKADAECMDLDLSLG